MKNMQGQNQITVRHQSVEEKEKLSKSTVPVLNHNFNVKPLTDCTMVKYHRPPMKMKSTKKMVKKKMVQKFRYGPKLSRVKRKNYSTAQLLSKLLYYGLILIFVSTSILGVGASKNDGNFDDHEGDDVPENIYKHKSGAEIDMEKNKSNAIHRLKEAYKSQENKNEKENENILTIDDYDDNAESKNEYLDDHDNEETDYVKKLVKTAELAIRNQNVNTNDVKVEFKNEPVFKSENNPLSKYSKAIELSTAILKLTILICMSYSYDILTDINLNNKNVSGIIFITNMISLLNTLWANFLSKWKNTNCSDESICVMVFMIGYKGLGLILLSIGYMASAVTSSGLWIISILDFIFTFFFLLL